MLGTKISKFHDFLEIFKFPDFSMHGIFFNHFPGFPGPVATLTSHYNNSVSYDNYDNQQWHHCQKLH